ncbi:MAG: winged helix-turn-helix transcriptional regulator [Bacteroidales bacterium]|nr:winged helix-turn-helix transcriptional regulator [Bacteroidales bacterium]MBR3946980.1 winged helix-turn-helix transcriptional regulator [Bacteroidales bacterium]
MKSQNIEYKEYPHSKNLAFAFYKAGFIESWGRGWQKICDGFVAAGLPKPTIESKQGGVLVTFQRNNVNLKNAGDIGQNKEVSDTMSNKMSNKEIKLMENNISENIAESIVENIVEKLSTMRGRIVKIVWKNPYASAQSISEEVGIAPRNVQEHLRKLQIQGIIRRIGPDKGGHWEIIEQSNK